MSENVPFPPFPMLKIDHQTYTNRLCIVCVQHLSPKINSFVEEAVDMTALTSLLITFSGQNECKSVVHHLCML